MADEQDKEKVPVTEVLEEDDEFEVRLFSVNPWLSFVCYFRHTSFTHPNCNPSAVISGGARIRCSTV